LPIRFVVLAFWVPSYETDPPGFVTVVDAANYSLDLFNSEAAYSQIAYGDIILLNKADLVDEADLDALEVKNSGYWKEQNSSHYAITSANPINS